MIRTFADIKTFLIAQNLGREYAPGAFMSEDVSIGDAGNGDIVVYVNSADKRRREAIHSLIEKEYSDVSNVEIVSCGPAIANAAA